MNVTIDERNPIDAARDLGPLIREHADAAERERRPAREVMDALAEAGLQRMLLPRSLDGLEVDPVTYARVAALAWSAHSSSVSRRFSSSSQRA